MATVVDAATGASRPASRHQQRRSMSRALGHDDAQKRAYEAGRRGEDVPFGPDDDADGQLLAAYNSGQDELEDQTAPSSSPPAGGTRRSSGRSSSPVSISTDDGAGLLLGLVLYALAAAYVRNGPAGIRQWIGAKFLNRPAAPAGITTPDNLDPTAPRGTGSAGPVTGNPSGPPAPQPPTGYDPRIQAAI